MSNENDISTSTRQVKLHMLQARLLLQRHRRQIDGSAKALRLARIIDDVNRLCFAVDGMNRAVVEGRL